MSVKPNVFIASSSEHLDSAYAVQQLLNDVAICSVWKHGMFRLSRHVLFELEAVLGAMDFGVFVLLPDDEVAMRGKSFEGIRDNVLFELGLFMGRLGSERCFALTPADQDDFRMPGDLAGLIVAPVARVSGDNFETALGAPCGQIRKRIKSAGRLRRLPGVTFSSRIEGVGDIKELIGAAREEILAVGPTLAYVAQYLEAFLFQRASEGVDVKLLAMEQDPASVRLIANLTCGDDFDDQLHLCHQKFNRWRLRGEPRIQVRQTPIVPYSITIIDGNTSAGKLLLVPTPYRASGIDRPCLLLEREAHPEAFASYYRATTQWWQDSRPIGSGVDGDSAD